MPAKIVDQKPIFSQKSQQSQQAHVVLPTLLG